MSEQPERDWWEPLTGTGQRLVDPFANPAEPPTTDDPAGEPTNTGGDTPTDTATDGPVAAPVGGPVDGPLSGGRVIDFPPRPDRDPAPHDSPVDDPEEDTATDSAGCEDESGTEPDTAGPESSEDGSGAGSSGAVVGPVLVGELVSEAENAELDRRLSSGALVRRAGGVSWRRTVWAAATVRAAVVHPHTRRTGKLVGRNLWYLVAGLVVLVKRWRDTHGATRYERMMRRAEIAGNHEALLEWESRDVAEKQRRHDRVMDWVHSPMQLVTALAVGTLATAGLLIGLGIILAFADHDIAMVLAPITTVIDAVAFVFWFLSVYGATLLLAATAGFVAYLWHAGRSQETGTPNWLLAEDRGDDPGALVTADAIVTALRHLPIPKLKQGFKEGWVPRFELTPTREGHGVFKGFRAIFDLPMGVTPEHVTNVREVLARNLHRVAVEVWPSDYGRQKGGKAGYINLYVADSGVMDKPTPEYPLLNEGTADVFEGVPLGITQRGDVVAMPIVGSNGVFGGQPGQGKSNAVRVAVAGVSLDPLAEVRMHVFAKNGDFDEYAPRLSRYEKGVSVEHIDAAVEHLQELYDEVGRREGRLAELNAKKLTRAIAEKHRDMRPLLVGFSECHELFGHPEHGKLAAELAINVVKRGRKTGVSLVFDTQSSRANAIPSQLVENVGFNGCFAVKTWRSNDGFLGDGSFSAGIRATDLRFNVDRGTMVATGATDELFEIVRTFYIKVDDDAGWDQATEIIERAMAQLAPGTPVAGDRPVGPAPEEPPDLLDDIAEVMRKANEELMRTQEVISALQALNPAAYKGWTFTRLKAALPETAKPYKTGGQMRISATRIAEARADRDLYGADSAGTDDIGDDSGDGTDTTGDEYGA